MSSSLPDPVRARMSERCREQADACRQLGSPLYERLLYAAADDVDREGACWQVLRATIDDPSQSMRALRLMGAVHRLALRGDAPELASFYPSTGGRVSDGVAEAFLATVEANVDVLQAEVIKPVQTNEVGRCAALVGGFLHVARTTGLALRCLEIGASAGLNLRWDHYLYEARGETWGDPSSPVRLCTFNSDVRPPFDVDASVVERRGCDRAPIDPTTHEGRVVLASFVWPDQVHRHRLLRAACDVARDVPVEVDAEPAAEWLAQQLAESHEGVATVVFHSIVMQYLSESERERVRSELHAAGRRAGARAPLAWLRMEPAGMRTDVTLTTWPGGDERLVATAGYHGQSVRWLVER